MSLTSTSPSPSPPLPPYSAVSPPPQPPPPTPKSTHTNSSRPTPEINLLLLGSPGIGKSTFISQLPYVRDGRLQRPAHSHPPSTPNPRSINTFPANPSTFNVSLFARPYNISLYRSTSTLFVDPFPEQIDALILCFAIDDRGSLFNARKYWRRIFAERYDEVPTMVLGLKRDLRHGGKRKVEVDGDGNERGGMEDEEFVCVMPEEGLEAAKELQCDRYAECSALTGELMFECLEDVTRMAAGTTTDHGGFSQGSGCVVI